MVRKLCLGFISMLACSSLGAEQTRVPVQIEIETGLDFSRMVQIGPEGEAGLDAQTGTRKLSGGLAELGGIVLRGTATVTGEPLAQVRIEMPDRIDMRASNGAVAEITDIETTLSPAPMLGIDGKLTFSFGGKMKVKGRATGNFRGNIRITADYQ
jgi:hypothetical protein